jgi:hypothetical protein
VTAANTISLPFLSSYHAAPSSRELAIRWIGLLEQERPSMVIDPALGMYAAWKASDLITHTLPPGHVASNGEWPTDSLRRMGVWIPEWWPAGSNPCESIVYNARNFDRVFELIYNSPAHRSHVLGEVDFYREQSRIAAVWAVNEPREPEEWWTIAVLVSLPAVTG